MSAGRRRMSGNHNRRQELYDRKEGLVPDTSNGSFRYLMENDGYYVDKTFVIKTLFAKGSKQVQLITRPRRFGKSLTLSMLYSFFTCVIDGKELSQNNM